MSSLEPTEEQKKFIEEARRHFDARLSVPPRESSKYMLDKFNSESGIPTPPEYRRKHIPQNKFVRLIEKIWDKVNWLCKLLGKPKDK